MFSFFLFFWSSIVWPKKGYFNPKLISTDLPITLISVISLYLFLTVTLIYYFTSKNVIVAIQKSHKLIYVQKDQNLTLAGLPFLRSKNIFYTVTANSVSQFILLEMTFCIWWLLIALNVSKVKLIASSYFSYSNWIFGTLHGYDDTILHCNIDL